MAREVPADSMYVLYVCVHFRDRRYSALEPGYWSNKPTFPHWAFGVLLTI